MMDQSSDSRRTPRWLFVLVIGLLLVQAGGVWSLGAGPQPLDEPAVLFDGLGYLLWGLVFGGLALAMIRQRGPAHRRESRALAAIGGYVLFNGLRLLLFAQADYDRGRLPFLALLLGVITVGIGVRWLLVRRRLHDRASHQHGDKKEA